MAASRVEANCVPSRSAGGRYPTRAFGLTGCGHETENDQGSSKRGER
jgi:hypothetical protein